MPKKLQWQTFLGRSKKLGKIIKKSILIQTFVEDKGGLYYKIVC